MTSSLDAFMRSGLWFPPSSHYALGKSTQPLDSLGEGEYQGGGWASQIATDYEIPSLTDWAPDTPQACLLVAEPEFADKCTTRAQLDFPTWKGG